MFIYTRAPRRSSHIDRPRFPGQRPRASFARQAVYAAFGERHGKALDQDSFADHEPGARMRLAPGSWFQKAAP